MSRVSLTKDYSVSKLENEDKTFYQKLKYIISNITVEPLLLLHMVPSVVVNLTTLNLNLEKACRVNLQYNSSACDAIVRLDSEGYEAFQEYESQKLVSNMMSIKMIIMGSYPTLLMLFVGSWSDRHGRRKPLILIPMLGYLVGTLCLYLCAHFFLDLSVEWSMMAETIPFALCGTWACEFLGIYTYVSEICKDEDRTIRIGALTICQNISLPLGMLLSSAVINILGYKGVYFASSVLLLISLTYGFIIVRESKILSEIEKNENQNSIREFFSTENVRSTFRVCFKQDANNRRSKMIVLMLLSFIVMGPLYGEFSVSYLYARLKCGWNEVDFGIYSCTQSVIQVFAIGRENPKKRSTFKHEHTSQKCRCLIFFSSLDFLGGVFALSFFSKFLGCDDTTLGIIAIISKIGSALIYAFAPDGLFFYIGALIEVFQTTSQIAMRSILAKIVPPTELGQSSSVFGIFESISPLIFGPIYTHIYNITIDTFPGTFYVVTACLNLISLYLFIWMYRAIQNDEINELKQYQLKLNDEVSEENTEKGDFDKAD